MRRTLFLLFTIIISILTGALLGEYVAPKANSQVAYRSSEEQLTIDIYKNTNEAVVFISTVTLTMDPFDIFAEVQPNKGAGTGTIIDSNKGIVITNLHVIENAHAIEILLKDGKAYKAKLLGYDNQYDIAVLQIKNPPEHLKSIPFGDSTRLQVGQHVLAIGNPFGLSSTLTSGIISSLDRNVRSPSGTLLKGLIQTDAAINPGNSGGPLIDMNGRLIGMNSAILSQSGDSAGIGFAVPMHQIKRILPELIATGKVLRSDFGWILVETSQGPMVRRVTKDGAADLAGVNPLEKAVGNVFVKGYIRDFENADLIYAINGKRVYTRNDIDDIILDSNSGEALDFTFRKGHINGPERTIRIKPNLN